MQGSVRYQVIFCWHIFEHIRSPEPELNVCRWRMWAARPSPSAEPPRWRTAQHFEDGRLVYGDCHTRRQHAVGKAAKVSEDLQKLTHRLNFTGMPSFTTSILPYFHSSFLPSVLPSCRSRFTAVATWAIIFEVQACCVICNLSMSLSYYLRGRSWALQSHQTHRKRLKGALIRLPLR